MQCTFFPKKSLTLSPISFLKIKEKVEDRVLECKAVTAQVMPKKPAVMREIESIKWHKNTVCHIKNDSSNNVTKLALHSGCQTKSIASVNKRTNMTNLLADTGYGAPAMFSQRHLNGGWWGHN